MGGIETHWLQAGEAPILYLHGVPTASFDWLPLLERTGGVAPDLPGFGRSGKPADFDYSIRGYDRWLESFTAELGLERFSLVVHDWGGVGLALAQRFPERVQKLVMFSCVPLLPGHTWHRVARGWRTPLVGELLMGFSTRRAFRRSLPAAIADRAWDCSTAPRRPRRWPRRAGALATSAARPSSCGPRTIHISARSSARATGRHSARSRSSSSSTRVTGAGTSVPPSSSEPPPSWVAST